MNFPGYVRASLLCRGGLRVLVSLALLVGCGGGDVNADDVQSAGHAGSQASAGSGGGTGSQVSAGSGGGGAAGSVKPVAGEYDVAIVETIQLQTYGGSFSSASYHLSLSEQGGVWSASLNQAGGAVSVFDVSFDPGVELSKKPDPFKNFTVAGPLTLTSGGSPVFAFDLDAKGQPSHGWTQLYVGIPGLLCTQNASGTSYALRLEGSADVTPPSVIGADGVVPWEAAVTLSEPATIDVDPVVTGASVSKITTEGLVVRTEFADALTLSGKTVTLSFPSITDRAGHQAKADAAVTFVDLGATAASHAVGDATSVCQGTAPGLPRRLVLAKPGASKARITFCGRQAPYNPGPTPSLAVRGWTSAGKALTQSATIEPPDAQGDAVPTVMEVSLPESTVALELTGQVECNGFVSVVSVEAL